MGDKQYMQIVWQETQNECGVCAVAMAAQAIHKRPVDRADVLLRANLSDGGMTISDLEALGFEFGLEIESYECHANELKTITPHKLHFALLRRPVGLHYVCFVYDDKKDVMTVYDSAQGTLVVSRTDFAREFAGVVCTIKKLAWPERQIVSQKFSVTDFISYGALSAQIALCALFVGLGIAGAQLLKFIFATTIEFGTTKNLFAIIAPFAMMKLIELLSSLVMAALQVRTMRDSVIKWWSQILRVLPAHDLRFWKQRPYGTLFELDDHLGRVVGFYCRSLAECTVAFVTVIICAATLATLNAMFVGVGCAQIAFSGLILGLKWTIQRKALPQMLGQVQKHNSGLSNLQDALSHEHWRAEYENLAAFVRTNTISSAGVIERLHWTNQLLDRVGDLVAFICSTLATGIGVSLVVQTGTTDVSNLMFVLGLLALLGTNSEKLINAGFNYPAFVAARKRFAGFVFYASKTQAREDTKTNPEEAALPTRPCAPQAIICEALTLVDGARTVIDHWSGTLTNLTVITGHNGTGKSSLLKAITGRFQAVTGKIWIDDQLVADCDPDWLFDNVIYCDGTYGGRGVLDLVGVCAKRPEIISFLRDAGLFVVAPTQRSAGQKQLARLASLQTCTNQIILLDEPLTSVAEDLRVVAFQTLIAPLANNNLVIFAEHDQNLVALARNVVDLGHAR